MPKIQRTPVGCEKNARGNVAIEFEPDTLFPVEGLEALYILPMSYDEFRRKFGREAPEPIVAFGKPCLTAADLVKVVDLLLKIPGLGGAEHHDEPLEPGESVDE